MSGFGDESQALPTLGSLDRHLVLAAEVVRKTACDCIDLIADVAARRDVVEGAMLFPLTWGHS